jgi:hypothetical protein
MNSAPLRLVLVSFAWSSMASRRCSFSPPLLTSISSWFAPCRAKDTSCMTWKLDRASQTRFKRFSHEKHTLEDNRIRKWEIQNKHLGTAGESRPMTAVIKPSYKNKALHETLSTRKALEKTHCTESECHDNSPFIWTFFEIVSHCKIKNTRLETY